MGANFRRGILRFTITVSLGTGLALGQSPAEEVLPDAPVATSPQAIIPGEKQTLQVPPGFTVGMSAKEICAGVSANCLAPDAAKGRIRFRMGSGDGDGA